MSISLIIPVFNEPKINNFLIDINNAFKKSTIKNYEIIVVDDNSQLKLRVKKNLDKKIKVLLNSANKGYGSSIMRGIDNSKYDHICIIDGDQTYPLDKIFEMYKLFNSGNIDMVVGQRILKGYQESIIKKIGRYFLKNFAEYISGTKILDINSGLRIFKKSNFQNYRNTLSKKFSFTSSITIAHILNDKITKYLPIDYVKRIDDTKSHVKYFRDTLRTIQSLTRVSLFFNPIKIFLLPIIIYVILISILTIFIILNIISYDIFFNITITTFFINVLFNFLLLAELISVNVKN